MEKINSLVMLRVDETYVGGKCLGKHDLGASGKSVVFGMMHHADDVMVEVMPNSKTKSIWPVILEIIKERQYGQ